MLKWNGEDIISEIARKNSKLRSKYDLFLSNYHCIIKKIKKTNTTAQTSNQKNFSLEIKIQRFFITELKPNRKNNSKSHIVTRIKA